MSATHHHHHHHHHAPHGAIAGEGGGGDPRCDGCGKRHTRVDFTPSASHRGGSIPTVRSSSKIVSIAALLLVASVAATESTTTIPLPTNIEKWATSSSISGVAKERWSSIFRVFGGAGGPPPFVTDRRLQEAVTNETAEEHEEEHHDEEDHEDHEGEDHEGEDHEGEDHEGHSVHEDEGTESDELQQSKRAVWTEVIGATFLINLATLVGVIVLFTNNIHGYCVKKGLVSKSTLNQSTIFDILILSFAAGALLATAVFLIIPEAIEMIGGGHDGDSTDSEGTVAAKFGCSFLGGFLLPLVIAIIFHKNDDEVGVSHTRPSLPAPADVSRFDTVLDTGMSVGGGDPSFASFQAHLGKDVEEQQPQDLSPRVPINQEDLAIVKPIINKKLILSVLLGDAFHNCADGILIAASFVSCDIAMAISITGVTIVHELAQELGDFILLTKHGGLTICQALILNFLSGLSVVVGAIIFLLANPSDQATGIMLTIGAGVYVNIAATETIPRLDQISKTRMHRVWTLIGCIVGTIPIGLVLLNHHHCEAEGAHEHNH